MQVRLLKNRPCGRGHQAGGLRRGVVGQAQARSRGAHRCFRRHQLRWFGPKDGQGETSLSLSLSLLRDITRAECACVSVSFPFVFTCVRPQYVRVSADTRPEVLYRLLTEQWKLSPPNLLISVTGGAKNFYLKGRLKSMFHRGIIKVAQTTGEPARERESVQSVYSVLTCTHIRYWER